MTTTIVTTKGQIVIPSKMRKRYGIKKGSRLCVIEEDGQIILQPLNREYFENMAGVLKTRGKLTKQLLEERAADKAREERKCNRS